MKTVPKRPRILPSQAARLKVFKRVLNRYWISPDTDEPLQRYLLLLEHPRHGYGWETFRSSSEVTARAKALLLSKGISPKPIKAWDLDRDWTYKLDIQLSVNLRVVRGKDLRKA